MKSLMKRKRGRVKKKVKDKRDSIILDLKTVYQDADNDWFYSPFEHHGIRMIKAAELYCT
jgi:hypothetical protein